MADIHLVESLTTEDQSDRYIEESHAKVDDKPATYTFRRYTGSNALTVCVYYAFIHMRRDKSQIKR